MKLETSRKELSLTHKQAGTETLHSMTLRSPILSISRGGEDEEQ